METNNSVPKWFWVVSIIALLWNLMGVAAYLGEAYMSEDALATLPEADQNFFNNRPAWVTASFAVAVFFGAIGCIGLLLKKKWASLVLLISLIAVLTQTTYSFFIQKDIQLSGTLLIMPVMVVMVSLLLVWFARKSTANGWLS